MSAIVAYARSSLVIVVPPWLGAPDRVEHDRGLEGPRRPRVDGVDRRERVRQEPADHLQAVLGDLDPRRLHTCADFVEGHGVLLSNLPRPAAGTRWSRAADSPASPSGGTRGRAPRAGPRRGAPSRS